MSVRRRFLCLIVTTLALSVPMLAQDGRSSRILINNVSIFDGVNAELVAGHRPRGCLQGHVG